MERVTEAALRRQRTIQTTLLFIILATLPCYCLGAVLLLTSPSQRGVRTPTPPGIITATTSSEPTNTPFPSITPFQLATTPFSPLQPTPTQIFLFPTAQPTLTFKPFFPSRTPVVLPSITPIIILPTNTPLAPTSTPFIPPTFTSAPPPTIAPPPATSTPPPVATLPSIPTLSSATLTETITPTLSSRRPTSKP